MSTPVIKIENVSKQFIIAHEAQEKYTTLRDTMTRTARKLFSFPKHLSPKNAPVPNETFWALKDVSFDINPGDRVGIIGRNGAGKSTLLKILSRITEPSSGRISIRGRVASLLEVGTGFHPELTGRENIYLNGAILGMARAEIKKKFDEIVAFAETEKFLDTPVKRYSSGMYVRLAFAVAAHLEPEILIVDEVLAVGDAQFQKKCLGKMKDVSAFEGRTILFVSHNMTAIKNLCDKIIYLRNGAIEEIGPTNQVINKYLSQNVNSGLLQKFKNPEEGPGNEKIKLRRLEVCPQVDDPFEPVTVNTQINVEIEFWNFDDGKLINLTLFINTIAEECVFAVVTDVVNLAEGLHKAVCIIPANFLNDNIYNVSVLIVGDASYAIYFFENLVSFEVNENRKESDWHGKWPGIVRPKLDFKFSTL